MARTIYPVEAKAGLVSLTGQRIRHPHAAEHRAALPAGRSLDTDGSTPRMRKRTAEEQSYLERVQNYIPAEIVAIFIFVNSLVATPVDTNGKVTPEGWVAVAAVIICALACFVFARVAAKQDDNPTFWLQGWMFVIALLIWVYALDAKILQVIDHRPIPALSGLLLVTFTMFSGLLVPTVKRVEPPSDASGKGRPDPSDPQQVLSADPAARAAAPIGGRSMSENPNHFCMCLRNKPGNAPIEGAERAAVLREAQWQPGTAISVTFLSGSEDLKARIRAVAEEWVAENMANLSFRWVDDSKADIRIAFNEGDGSWSYLGTVCRQIEAPRPTMNYGWLSDTSTDEELRRVVLHEFGHALGMIHEHQNPEGGIRWNEAAVINDLSGPPNNWDLDTIRVNVLNKYNHDAVTATEVDADSIMMYPIPASWTDGTFSADLNGELSLRDKKLIREVYP